MVGAEGQDGEEKIDHNTRQEAHQRADDDAIEELGEVFLEVRSWKHGVVDAVLGEVAGLEHARRNQDDADEHRCSQKAPTDNRRNGDVDFGYKTQQCTENPHRCRDKGYDEHGHAETRPHAAKVHRDELLETIPIKCIIHIVVNCD